ncbi:MAG: DUF4242 domain-containing protein [Oscillatoriales cyanobacterium RU_3_3]|nr:DUF4242 domain-containing protein [Microcoleus sp. SU_5_6]NJL66136.1 DUF4242 domain-containing protein [Microcoleus sp. SM1_3_4]NJM62678.1 DUF4242 domain-containing protein [Oscillatoriales cyanobacterium RU_3_3]NJR21697.1 DUF4242 domain-containing protein [Richelia sp. CSU_2_1]
MTITIVETLSDSPLTPEELTDVDYRVWECLTERNATWRYSLLSVDRHRMICTFDAPDAESVRESYRKAGGFFNRIWAGEIVKPEGIQPQHNEAILKVFEGTYPPISQAELDEVSHKTLNCYVERGIEWIQSYLSFDRTRLICELNAPDLESVREVQRKLNIPFDRVWSAMVIRH